jgi:hypothetical protein
MPNCFICNNEASVNNSNVHEPEYDCSECGEYSITEIAMNIIPKERYPNWSQMLQRFVKENQATGSVVITVDKIKTIFGF